jgi:8-oxo-dGTP diphosphatase
MKVAVAVIIDDEHRILITQRAQMSAHGGLWEFPGGKVEADETPYNALVREVLEETGLQVLHAKWLTDVSYEYPNHQVELSVYVVDAFHGEATCCEQQMNLQWVAQSELSSYPFPEANDKIIDLLIKS